MRAADPHPGVHARASTCAGGLGDFPEVLSEMTANESGGDRQSGAAEPTAVLPETAAQLEEIERLQQALAESEERAKSHWEQYLRAVAELDNMRKRAQRDIEAANRY